MLLMLLYIVLIGLILWSIGYLIWRVIRSFRGKGSCSCCTYHCDSCEKKDSCKK